MMNLDTENVTSLWIDQVVLEVNIAILCSFQKQGVTITDHHSASASFVTFMDNEYKHRGGCPADWIWINPPLTASVTPVFHQEMLNYKLKPSYEYMDKAWVNHKWQRTKSCGSKKGKRLFKSAVRVVSLSNTLMVEARSRRVPVTVLYATETGRSEKFAYKLFETLDAVFQPSVCRMDEYDFSNLANERMLFIVSSTFGEGKPPANGLKFLESLRQLSSSKDQSNSFAHVHFSVFGFGSRAYPKFCAAAYDLDQMLSKMGMSRIHPIGLGDSLKGQEASFSKWSRSVLKESCKEAQLKLHGDEELDGESLPFNTSEYRLIPAKEEEEEEEEEVAALLSKVHNKDVFLTTHVESINLQSSNSERKTYSVALSHDEMVDKVSFQPGDHVGVFPKNEKSEVNKILGRTVFMNDAAKSADAVVKVESRRQNEWIRETRFPPTTLRTALTYLLDIRSSPDQLFLEALVTHATDEEDRNQLLRLSRNIDAYEEWVSGFFCSMDTMLDTFRYVIEFNFLTSWCDLCNGCDFYSYFIGINFRGDKLLRSSQAKINFHEYKFREWAHLEN